MLKATVSLLIVVALAAPVGAQDDAPAISFRPYFLVTGQQASAKTTFNAVFGNAVEPFFGAGLQLALRDGVFVEVSASRFKKTGERAFLNNGHTFRLGIPLTATIIPFEVTGGYRFNADSSSLFVPYVGAGAGWYGYRESSQFSTPAEDVDTHHVGYLAFGGVEFRVHRWVGLSIDAQYTHIPGILGIEGLSKDAGENDLGGIAARFRVIVGR
jgi:outer membrane protein W